MKRIADGVYEWSQYQTDRGLDFNGHFLQPGPGEAGALVDPVAFHPGDLEQLAGLGGVAAVILTNGDHVREAIACRERFGCPILVPAADLARAGVPDAKPFAPGDQLPGGLVAVAVPDNKSPGETALFHDPSNSLVVGDAAIGTPMGALSLLAPEKYADVARAARGLRALLTQGYGPLKRLLVGDGASILGNPSRAIQALIYQHDPAACILRRAELAFSAPFAHKAYEARSAEISALLGLEVIDFDLTVVPPGKLNCPLHRHDGEEEVFVILAGVGELVTEAGAFPIQAGDVLGFPPRFQVAHQLRNTGQEELAFLAMAAPAEVLEMVDYPLSNKRLEKARFGKSRLFFLPERLREPYFAGDPDG